MSNNTYSGIDLADYAGIVMSRMGNSQGDGPDSEGWITTPDNTGLHVACYIDHDYIDYALVEVRSPFRYRIEYGEDGNYPEGPTMVDWLFIIRYPEPGLNPDPRRGRDIEWRQKPYEIFAEDIDHWAPYREFMAWCESQTDAWHERSLKVFREEGKMLREMEREIEAEDGQDGQDG